MQQTFLYLQNQIENLDIFKILNDDLVHINEVLNEISKKFRHCDNVLIFGVGGSSLGGKCLVNFHAAFYCQELRVKFVENVDSMSFMNVISKCSQNSTGIIVISKSGRTTETLVLFSTLCEIWRNFDYQNRAIVITEFSENNPLKSLAEAKQMKIYEHDKNIGGRFSVFSIVGLLPAFLAGVDIVSFLDGAKIVRDEIKNTIDARDCKIYQDIIMLNKELDNRDQYVVMSYSDFMDDFGRWFSQLLAESLGKSINFGITPIRAIGSVDQHSLLQLFLAGPRNKLFTIIIQRNNVITSKIISSLESINKKTIHDVMIAHQLATIEVLREVAPVRVLEFESFSINSLGFLMMLSIIEILTIAHLRDINPFDQPAVEASKRFVNKYLMNCCD